MLNIYARAFLEASRFTPQTRVALPEQHMEKTQQDRARHTRLWQRGPYWA